MKQNKLSRAVSRSISEQRSALEALAASKNDYEVEDDSGRPIVDALSPVKGDPAIVQDFNKVLYPNAANTSDPMTPIRATLSGLIPEMTRISFELSRLFGFLQYVATQAGILEDYNKEELEAHLNSVIASYSEMPDEKDMRDFFLGEQRRISGGYSHIIQPSGRYTGGMDIKFLGAGGGQSGILFPSNAQRRVPTHPTNGEYENMRYGNFLADLGQRAIRAAELIQERIRGKAPTVKDAHKRDVVTLPFDFDFASLNTIVSSTLGINLNTKLITNMTPFLRAFGDYMQLLVIFDPRKELIEAQAAGLVELRPAQPNEELIVRESVVLQPRISTSFEMNLKEELVEYITQSEDGSLVYYGLDTWVKEWVRALVRVSGASKSVKSVRDVPRFILPISRTENMAKVREAEGYYVDPGRLDDNDITVAPTGSIKFVPKPSDMSYENTRNYEQDIDKCLRAHFEKGVPYNSGKDYGRDYLVTAGSTQSIGELSAAKDRVMDYKGSLLGFNWDLNVMVTAGIANPTQQQTVSLAGSTVPDALTLADYLGFDFAEEGEVPIKNNFVQALILMGLNTKYIDEETNKKNKDSQSASLAGITNDIPNWLLDDPIQTLFITYAYLVRIGAVNDLNVLLSECRRELNITTFGETELDKDLYNRFLNDNGTLLSAVDVDQIPDFLTDIVAAAARDAAAIGNSNLLRKSLEENGSAGLEAVRDMPQYFDPARSTLADITNMYQYFGGYLFYKVCEQVAKTDKKNFIKRPHLDDSSETVLPAFSKVSNDVLPLAVMFSKYVHEAEKIFEEAEAISESYEPDESVDVEDIVIPGTNPDLQMFPHQLDAHRVLRKKPKFAILDVAPGGGKTITLLSDVACCVAESDEPIRPLIIAPNGLVANWCEDMIKVAGNKWNVVPITTTTWGRWGPERLAKLIENAPPNTIYVASISALKGKSVKVSYGTRQFTVSGVNEFLRKYKFNYIALDESHKAKNVDSQTNLSIKALTTLNHVKFVRLATGTLVTNRIPDVIGQTALMSSHIFRTPGYFAAMFDKDAPDAPHLVRSKLAKHCAIVTKRRKHWAFMLPIPLDVLLRVDMVTADNPGSEIHGEVYQAILKIVLDELQESLKKAKRGKGPSEDDEEEAGGIPDEGSNDFAEEDDDDDFSKINAADLQRNLQRLEQIIIDPNGDPLFQEAASQAGIRNFVSNKILETIKRLDVHFQTVPDKVQGKHRITPWKKGEIYQELDLVEYNDELWLARKFDSANLDRMTYDASMLPPPEDPDRWKRELHGKVIIFCRYKRSVDAVYAALPPKYKSIARPLHSGIAERAQNLEDFKYDPDVKILIANEQSITEGHNLQVASRIIRVEHPWTPGDYDQSTARIFRPDPAASKLDENGRPGDMPRELIMIDWLMTENTLEIPKVARLMQKTVEKTRFDEKGNSRYDSLITMEDFDDEEKEILSIPIRMNLDKLAEASTFDDYVPHFKLKSLMNNIEATEFSEMRKTTVASMVKIPTHPPLETFSSISSVPLMANQKIPKPDGYDVKRVSEALVEHLTKVTENGAKPVNRKYLEQFLMNHPVKTEFGTGIITGFNTKTIKMGSEKVINPDDPVSTLRVVYADGTIDTKAPAKSTFLALGVKPEDMSKFVKGKPFSNKKEKERVEAARKRESAKEKEREDEAENFKEKAKAEAKTQAHTGRKARKRRENVQAGKPANDGVITHAGDPANATLPTANRAKAEPLGSGKDMAVKVIPTMYDGFVALHVNNDDPDALDLTKLGFNSFGEFVYVEAKHYNYVLAQIRWLEDYVEDTLGMALDSKSEDRLFDIQEAFEYEKKGGFNLKMAVKAQAALPQFYRTRHREIKDTKKVKVYTQVLPDRVRLVIDLRSNPKLRKIIGKTVPRSGGGKWKLHEGMHVYLTTSKSDAKAKLKELISSGYKVGNASKVLEAISALKLVRRS